MRQQLLLKIFAWTLPVFMAATTSAQDQNAQSLLENTPVPSKDRDFVVICPVEGDILDGIAVLVERAVTRNAVDAKAIVFVIDTFGGRVDSAIAITQTIMEANIPTIAYITGKGAISAGALIAYACDHIIMAPGANIGASTPIMMGAEPSEQVNEKSMSFLRAKYRALGEEKGHNPLIGEAMVDSSIELWGRKDETGKYVVYKVERGRVVESHENSFAQHLYAIELSNFLMEEETPTELQKAAREILETVRDVLAPPPSSTSENGERNGSEFGIASAAPMAEGLPADAQLINPSGKLLTLTAREAQEIGLIAETAESPEKALYMLGFSNFGVMRIEMTWAEALFSFLTSPLISGLLLLCGVGGIYIEFRTPGLGLPGLIGVCCLALFFGSRLILGIANWLDVLLVITGLILLAVEILVLPGFGLAGIFGMVCLVVGIYLSLIRVPIPQYTWDFMRLRDAGTTLMLACGLLLLFMGLTWKLFPQSYLGRGLRLNHAQSVEEGYVVQTAADASGAMGLQGKSATMLHPVGRGRFGGNTYDVMTRGEFIESGRPIEIIQAEGNRYVVREIQEEEHV